MLIGRLGEKMKARSSAVLASIDHRLDLILVWWIGIAAAVSVSRIAMTGNAASAVSETFASYMLIVIAPVAATLLSLRYFYDGAAGRQPATRLARVGRWIPVSRAEAERHPLYGTGGFMVSVLVGMMLNVPIRAAEYLASMPPAPSVTPRWFSALHFAMTFDAALFSSLYMVAFVAALRKAPIFPRLLVAIWLSDLLMQLFTAWMVMAARPVPPDVAAALTVVLIGNVKKVLIRIGIWMPYLLLSKRVNVTYRHRIAA